MVTLAMTPLAEVIFPNYLQGHEGSITTGKFHNILVIASLTSVTFNWITIH